MAPESVAAKAARYLREGRLTVCRVDADVIQATCRGSHADPETGGAVVYRLGWCRPSGWHCSCASFGTRCAHLTALRLVTIVQPAGSPAGARRVGPGGLPPRPAREGAHDAAP